MIHHPLVQGSRLLGDCQRRIAREPERCLAWEPRISAGTLPRIDPVRYRLLSLPIYLAWRAAEAAASVAR